MAELKFEFKATGLQQITQSVSNLQAQLQQLSSQSTNINIGGNVSGGRNPIQLQADSILGLRQKLNDLLRTYGQLSEAQRSSGGVQNNLVPEINRLREAVAGANREYDNLRRGTGRPIPSDSIVGMRNRLNELRRTYDNLSESQRNSGRVQRNLVGEIGRLNTAISTAEQATGRYQRNVGNYQRAQSGANGVAMEFNRIIQDAPFGMMGVGNNIQQLASNWQVYVQQARAAAAANGTTVSTMTLMRGALSTMMSPINLVTMGIAIVTSAWTAYSMNVKTAKEETKDMNNTFTSQIGHLNSVISLSKKQALTERDKATAISMYNKELGATLGKAKDYEQLERRLISNGASYVDYLFLKAQAEATYQLALKQTGDMMNNIMMLESKGRSSGFGGWLLKAGDVIDEFVYGNGAKGQTKITSQEVLRIVKLPTDKEFYIAIRGMGDALKKGLKVVRQDWKKSIQSFDLGSDLTQQFNGIADKIGSIPMPDLNLDKEKKLKKNVNNIKELFDYLGAIRGLLSDKKQSLDLFDLEGQRKELAELQYSYDDFFSNLGKLKDKANKDKGLKDKSGVLSAIDDAKKVGEGLQDAETLKIFAKYAEEAQSLMDELNAKYGDVSGLTKQEEAIKKLRAEFVKYKEQAKLNEEIDIDALNDLEKKGELAIKVKIAIEGLEDIDKLEKQLIDIADKPFDGKNKNSIQKELDKRIIAMKEAYDKLVDMMRNVSNNTGFKMDEETIKKFKVEIELMLKKGADEANEANKVKVDFSQYTQIANNAINNVFTNLSTNVEQFGFGMTSVLATLGDAFNSVINDLASKTMTDFFNKIKEGSKLANEDIAGAAATMLGGIISSSTSKTSMLGQGLGGALSGAGSMAATGNPYLMAGGAVVGLLGGIFGSKKAQKQEELQRQQLLEQKRANALLERMNALSYASQIIGGRTEHGIVGGVNRNEFGEITFKINGQDLVASLNRQGVRNGR